MTTIGYVSEDFFAKEIQSQAIKNHAENHNIELSKIVTDPSTNRTHWENRALAQEIKLADPGSTIIVYEASNLARSSAQVLEIFEALTQKNISIYFIKYNICFEAKDTTNATRFIQMIQAIESDFVAKRTTEALSRRRDEGLPLGRPKGRVNKALKLDKNRKDIQKYLDLGISKASIAKLINCHAQTLYNYIDKRELSSQN